MGGLKWDICLLIVVVVAAAAVVADFADLLVECYHHLHGEVYKNIHNLWIFRTRNKRINIWKTSFALAYN